MLSLPQVSIITPTLNQGSFIALTIESVLAQDYPALEYIVIDGGSTDQTLTILSSYKSRVQWISEADNGQSSAINKGWRKSKGEILAWLNSDDLLEPGTIQQIVAAFQQHPETAMIYGECNYINQAGQIVGKFATRPWNYAELLKKATNFIPQPSVFIKRKALEKVGWLDESLHYLMDYDLFLRVGSDHSVLFLPETLAGLRLHNEAKSLRALKGFGTEMVEVVGRIFDSGKLPEDLLKCDSEAMGKAYLYAASTSYWGGDVNQARTWLTKCWQQVSWSQIPAPLIRLSLLSAFGQSGLPLAERWIGNPFMRQLANRKE